MSLRAGWERAETKTEAPVLGYCLLMYGRVGLGHEVTELDCADTRKLEAGTQQRQEAQRMSPVICALQSALLCQKESLLSSERVVASDARRIVFRPNLPRLTGFKSSWMQKR